MESLNDLAQGFATAFTPTNVAMCFLGVFLGQLVGVLPGIGPSAAIALLLPLTFGMWVVVPIQPYAEGVANGLVEPGFFDFLVRYYGHTVWPEGAFAGWEHGFTWNHLWYLAYLWTYTCVFALLLPLLRRLPNPLAQLRGVARHAHAAEPRKPLSSRALMVIAGFL